MDTKEGKASAAAVAALIVGILVVSILRNQFGIKDSATTVALLIIPFAAYALATRQVQEFTAGGVTLSFFQETASTSLNPGTLALPFTVSASLGEEEWMVKERIEEMHEKIVAAIPGGGPKALTLVLGEPQDSKYVENQVAEVVDMLSELPNFKFVVIVDVNSQVVAYAPPYIFSSRSALVTHLRLRLPKNLVDSINNGQEEAIRNHPATTTEVVSTDASNTEALEMMQSNKLDALVVVDEEGQFMGVIERTSILNQMMLALVAAAEGTN